MSCSGLQLAQPQVRRLDPALVDALLGAGLKTIREVLEGGPKASGVLEASHICDASRRQHLLSSLHAVYGLVPQSALDMYAGMKARSFIMPSGNAR